MAPIRICAVVPTHNHHQALGGIIAALRAEGLAVFVIDDGSAEPAASAIATVHAPDAGVTVHRFASNQGKGVAVTTGFRLAWEAGFTHAVQIDADGQHDTTALPALLEHSRRHPDALISAWPVYDASMPLGRRIGRCRATCFDPLSTSWWTCFACDAASSSRSSSPISRRSSTS